MSKELAITLAVVIIGALLIIFGVSFVAYRRTPAPKGCEKLEPTEEMCGRCPKAACPIRWSATKTDDKEEKE